MKRLASLVCMFILSLPFPISASNIFDRSERICAEIHDLVYECNSNTGWMRTFPGNLPVDHVRYALSQSGRIVESVVGQVSFTPFAPRSELNANELNDLALQLGTAFFAQRGEPFQIMSSESTQLFGESANQTSISFSLEGIRGSVVYSTVLLGAMAIQFMTLHVDSSLSHIDYQLHQSFLSEFRVRRAL